MISADKIATASTTATAAAVDDDDVKELNARVERSRLPS